MTSVVISGASGRLGGRILGRCLEAPDLEVAAALVRPGSAPEGGAVLGSSQDGLRYTSDARSALTSGSPAARRVLIEAALVPAALEHAAVAADVGAPMCIATTGFDGSERRTLEAYAAQVPVLIAPNLSLGVTVLLDLVRTAARALDGYHLEVLEMHHAKKRDAPSGTAWALAREAAAARGRDIERDAILARGGHTGERGQHEVGLMALRGGDVIGEHTVFLVGDTERVELTHRAAHRDAFAAGAVAAARFLADAKRRPGLYGMRDVVGLGSDRDP